MQRLSKDTCNLGDFDLGASRIQVYNFTSTSACWMKRYRKGRDVFKVSIQRIF
jgi:hypothetical protein